jgi:hypothetical protein
MAGAGWAQTPPPPPPPNPEVPTSASTAGDLRTSAERLVTQVRRLNQEAANALAAVPSGGGTALLRDIRELDQAADEFRARVADPRADAFQARRSFAAIDGTWNHLKGQLNQMPPGTLESFSGALQGVDQAEEKIRAAIGMNAPPPDFYSAGNQAPSGFKDIRRTANALVSRAEAVAASVPQEMADDPNVAAIMQDAKALATAADRFHDSLDSGQSPQTLQTAYGPVVSLSDRLGTVLNAEDSPPRLRRLWQGYAYCDALMRQALGMSVGANVPTDYLRVPQGDPGTATTAPASSVVPLANKLVAQLDDFLAVFTPTAGAAAEGLDSLEDARRLRAAAIQFQAQAAQGAAPNQLAFAFRDVDVYWQRLGRRVERLAKGRSGPNIDRVRMLGQTCEQLHQMLAMPGYPMTFPGQVAR